MLTLEHMQKLYSLIYDRVGFKEKFPDYSYYHGVVAEIDVQQKLFGFVADDTDGPNQYFAMVIDDVKRDAAPPAPLKDLITGANTAPTIERLMSSSPQEIEQFIQKWLDKAFKFD